MARTPRKRPEATSEATTQEASSAKVIDINQLRRVRPLGYDHGTFFYYSDSSKQVHDLTASNHSKLNLLSMAPISFWHSQFGAANGKIDWDAAASQFMAQCRGQGVYNPDRVRGRGAWFDAGRTILHLGNQCLVDGNLLPLADLQDSYYLYEAGAALKPPSATALPVTQAREVIKLARRFRWVQPVSAYLLAGFCAIAPICGALAWRPHVWVTGGSGTGKSTVAIRFMLPLMGQSTIHVQGATTEPGLRGKLRNDALPVLFDEAESNDKTAQERTQQILEMMRSSSSDSGAMLKGSATGAVRSTTFRSCFSLVSINPGLKAAADRGRISFLTLTPAPNLTEDQRRSSEAQWQGLSRDLDALLSPAFCDAFLARSVRMIPVIRNNAAIFADAVTMHLGQRRLGDQVGTLLAGAYSLNSDEAITAAAAKAFVEQQEWSEVEEALNNRDEEKCLRHLLQSHVQVETNDLRHVTRSVAELAMVASGIVRDTRIDRAEIEDAHGRVTRETQTEVIGPESADLTLRRHGIRAEAGLADGHVMTVANDHIALARIFRDTPWAGNWGAQLKRLPFAEASRNGLSWPKPDASAPKLLVRGTHLDLDEALKIL